jgi:chromate reductase
VLKNAIKHAWRHCGHSAWAGKPAGVIGVSAGALGTAMSHQHVRNVLAYLDWPAMSQPEAFVQAKDGLFDSASHIGANSRAYLQNWMDHCLAWVLKHTR